MVEQIIKINIENAERKTRRKPSLFLIRGRR